MAQVKIAQGAGTATVVTGPQSTNSRQIIYVTNCTLVAAGTGTIKFTSYDGSTDTDLTGPMDVSQFSGYSANTGNPDFPLFQTRPGESLRIVVTGTTVNGFLTYGKKVAG